MPDETRRQLAQTARLWTLSLICAAVGAYTVWRTDNLMTGIAAFLLTLMALGLPLWLYERWRKARDDKRD